MINPKLSILMMIIGMFCFQLGAALAKAIFAEVGAYGASALRLFFAALFLFLLRRPWKYKTDSYPRARRQLLLYGASLGAMNLFFYLALERISLGVTVALEFTGPLMVTLFSSRSRLDFLWFTLAATGVYMVLPLPHRMDFIDPVGVGYALTAGFFWAMYIVFGQRAIRALPSAVVSSYGMIVAAMVVIPFGWAHAGNELLVPWILLYGMGIAALSSAIPYTIEIIVLKSIPRKNFGILLSLAPAIAAISGVLLLKEVLTPLKWAAIILIICASIGSAAALRRQDPQLNLKK